MSQGQAGRGEALAVKRGGGLSEVFQPGKEKPRRKDCNVTRHRTETGAGVVDSGERGRAAEIAVRDARGHSGVIDTSGHPPRITQGVVQGLGVGGVGEQGAGPGW